MDIQEAILRSKQGDREAFGEVFDYFADRLYRFIKYKTNNRFAAEDILQEVFLKAWLGLPRLPEDNLNFSAWLYKIASNTANDYFREQYRTPNTLDLDSVIEILDDEHSTQGQLSDSMDIDGEMKMVNKAFEHLPSQYRQILELRFIQDLTLDETAEIVGKTNLAVRILQHRALKKLREIIHTN